MKDTSEQLRRIGKQAGMNDETFNACLANQSMLDALKKGQDQALEKFKVDSTPTFFINGTKLAGIELDRKTMADLAMNEGGVFSSVIAQAKAKPGGFSYASAGAGSPHHLAMEMLKAETGLFMVHVPYRGAAPALADVAGGQLPAMMVDLAAGAGFIKGGKVRPLAVTTPLLICSFK